MITLFRRIRQKLIDSGSVTKYLLYAIGEILLVVIGILIALQINNWNEQIKKDQLKDEYTLSMLSDLQLDLQTVLDMRAYNEEELQKLDSLANIIQEDVQDIRKMRQLNINPSLSMITNLNNSTYQALISLGSIDLYRKELRDKLIEHHRVQNLYLQSYENSARVFFETMNTYLQSGPLLYDDRWLPPILREDTWLTIDKSRYVIAFNALLIQRSFLLNNLEDEYKELEDSTRELIHFLENETD